MDAVPSRSLFSNFFAAVSKLQQPIEQLLAEMEPCPSCIIADNHLAWTADVADKFHIPRLLFDGTSCFNLLCCHNLHASSKVLESVSGSNQPFTVPGLPDRIELTKAQLPSSLNPSIKDFRDLHAKIRASGERAYGVVVNSFEELESEYVKEYRKAKGDRSVWCIGAVSLSNKADLDKAQRGNNSSIDENKCLKWLDSWPQSSVVYACLGSLSRLPPSQLIELGLGLEACNRPFIWVLRGDENGEMEKWIKEDGFEEKTKERGLLIRGWAPQVLILSHPAIGGFLTHCGWNSTLEGVCAGVPMVTWPIFAEQFFNEKLVAQVLKIGERVGNEIAVPLGEEGKYGVLVNREQVREAIGKIMSEGKEGEDRRERSSKLAEMAKKATEEGGSSYLDITFLMEDIRKLAFGHQALSH